MIEFVDIAVNAALILNLAVSSSMIAAFVLLLLNKWGVIEYVQVHGNDFFVKMFSCWFCLSWWSNVLISIIIGAVLSDWAAIAVPFIATPITRKML